MSTLFARRTSDASTAWFSRALKVFPGGTTRSTLDVTPSPPYFASGSGHQLTDIDGHVVIDAQNNYTSLIHGHARREVVAAARAALEGGASVGLPSRYEIEHAERLVSRFSLIERIRFANSGTEAVMMAIRTARAATGRHTILRFAGAYHGTFEDVVTGAHSDRDALVYPYNDATALRSARIDAPLAAILIDLMPNRAGLRAATPDFIEAVHDLAERADALIIADEVITGRLAYGGLAVELGLKADLVVLGKIIGGGHPIGAFGGRRDVMSVFESADRRLSHGGTFTANPVTMSAGAAAIDLYDADEVTRLNALGDVLRGRMADRGALVTGRGSLLRIHAADETALWWSAYREGVLIGNNGLVALSTAMNDETIDVLADRLGAALDRITELDSPTHRSNNQ